MIVFNKNISMFELMGLYMYNMLHFHTNTIKIYSSFNEYLFFEKSTAENTPVLDYINNTMNDICDTFSEEISFLFTVAENIPGLSERLLKIQKEKLCNLNDFCDKNFGVMIWKKECLFYLIVFIMILIICSIMLFYIMYKMN